MSAPASKKDSQGEFARSQRAAQYVLSQLEVASQNRGGAWLRSRRFRRRIGRSHSHSLRENSGFPKPTAEGHAGRLVIGKISGISVAAMQGRVHFYEGYSMKEVVYPMRVFRQMGIRSRHPDQCRRRRQSQASIPAT